MRVPFPERLVAEGFELRAWQPEDAWSLHAALLVEHERLAPWIPARAATPGTVEETTARLRESAEDIAHGRAWRYGMWRTADGELVGEFDAFPRDASARVTAPFADRVEFG